MPVGALGSNFGGLVRPKNTDVVYFRGDGGSYRWDPVNNRWISISDSTPIAKPQYDVIFYGGGGASALAIDPNDVSANIVYMASLNEIWKSSNRGTSWTGTGLKRVDGTMIDTVDNGNGRWQGERLMVDPNNSSVIYYATNNDGLWRNTTGGSSGWSQPSSFPWRGEKDFGVCFVAFDKSGGTVTVTGQSVSARMYAGVSVINSGGTDGGVYRSTNGGQTWEKVGGLTLGAIDWGQTAPNGTLYVTHSNGVAKIPAGQINLVACTAPWPTEPTRGHGPLAVAQSDSTGNTLYVSINAYGTAPNITIQNNRWNHNPISRSTDGGQTWSNISQAGTWHASKSNLTYTPDQFAHQVNWLAVSPANPNHLWMGDDTQVYRTTNAAASNAASVVWSNPIAGFEGGTFSGKALCPPGGAPVFGLDQDIGLFRFRDVNQYPLADDLQRTWADASGVDFCETDPNFIAYAGTNGASTYITEGGVAVTSTNGNAWTVVVGGGRFGQHDPIYHGGRIVVGATKQGNGLPVIIHYPEGTGSPRYSTNWGSSWSNVAGLPTEQINWYYAMQQVLAADRVNGNKFYFLEGSFGGTNRLYYSTNGGQSFVANWTLPLTYTHGLYGDVMAVPGREGEVLFNQVDYNSFANAGDEAFYRVTRADTGSPVVTKVVGMFKVFSFSVGKSAPGFSTPALYIFGRTNFGGVTRVGIFRSDDALALGKSANMSDATWVQIYNPDTDSTAYGVLLRGKTTLQADRQTYGRIYFSTGGRGFWRGDEVGSSLPVVSTPSFSPAGGTYSSGQSVTLSVATSGATTRAATLPVSSTYELVEMKDINITNGQCTVGIWSDGYVNNWVYFDDVEFFKQ